MAPDPRTPDESPGKKPPSTAELLEKLKQKRLGQKSAAKKPPASPPSPAKPPVHPVKKAKPAPSGKPTEKPTPPKRGAPAPKIPTSKKPVPVREIPSAGESNDIPAEESPKPVSRVKRIRQALTSRRTEAAAGVSEVTIPKLYYSQIKRFVLKRRMTQVFVLVFMAIACFGAIRWVAVEFGERTKILRAVSDGMQQLENSHLPEAGDQFRRALDLYLIYQASWFNHLRFRDGLVETTLIRAAQGWRSIGDYKEGFEVFQQICLNKPHGKSSWLDNTLQESLTEFVGGEHWDENEYKEMYSWLLQQDPASWGNGSILQIRATEWVSLRAIPVTKRFEEAGIVILGVPSPEEGGEKDLFRYDAQFFYKEDQFPGEVHIVIGPALGEAERKRLDWYVQKKYKCLLFCRLDGERYMLNRMDGIMLSENPFVEEFNRVVNAVG